MTVAEAFDVALRELLSLHDRRGEALEMLRERPEDTVDALRELRETEARLPAARAGFFAAADALHGEDPADRRLRAPALWNRWTPRTSGTREMPS